MTPQNTTKARYIRISSKTQTTLRQEVKQHPDERIFIDVISGAIPFNKRPAAKELLFAITMKQVDYLSVSEVSRLGRDAFDIQSTLKLLDNHGVTVRIEDLGNLESRIKDKPNPVFKLIVDVLANIAQMSKEYQREAQRQGINAAKAIAEAGGPNVYANVGRKKGSVDSPAEIVARYKSVAKALKDGKSLRDTAARCDVALGTVQKVKKALAALEAI